MKPCLPVGIAMLLGACSVALAADPSAKEAAAMKVKPFPLRQVRLVGPLWKECMERDLKYLNDLDANRLLHNFRVQAGVPSTAQPLGGWEEPKCELRGHFTGHYLTAYALMYASTGDEKIKAKADRMVAELTKCQEPSGYLSAFPEEFFDRVEAGKGVWAPYYTIHKIMAGLLDMHQLCGNTQALEMLKGMAAYFKGRCDKLSDGQMGVVMRCEFGGMNEVLCNLYAVTGDENHLALAHRFDNPAFLGPLADGKDNLTGRHANTHIPQVTGAARRYEVAGDEQSRKAAQVFWDAVANHRSYVTGGTSHREHWGKPDELAGTMSHLTQETCCTYNMLKLTRHLFAWTADPRYADYYERAFFNAILGTQDPKTGMMMYFVPMQPGYYKVFNRPLDAFWCCTGTGVESFAKLADSIYFHDGDGLYVNLFIASDLDWAAKGVRVEQRTDYPREEGTTLVIRAKEPEAFTLNLRVPWWAAKGAAVKVNGQIQVAGPTPSSYVSLQRLWKEGDRVEVSMPMSLRVETMPDDKTVRAIEYGPVVLAGRLGTEGLTEAMAYEGNNWANLAPAPTPAPFFVVENDDPASWVRPVEGKPLVFRTAGQERDVTLEPWYALFGERYGIYWKVLTKGSPEHRAYLDEQAVERRREGRRVDRVLPNDGSSEQAHGLKGEKTAAGLHMGRQWRDANGGWFSYELKAPAGGEALLVVTYWGGDVAPRTFDVLVDGRKVATQTLNNSAPGKFFDVEYRIPADLTRGKEKVTVKFQAHAGNIAGGVFGCQMLKADAGGK